MSNTYFQVHVGLIVYSDQAIIEASLDQFFTKAELSTAVDELHFLNSNTNTAAGLEKLLELYSLQHGDRVNVPDIGIVFTDGTSNIRTVDLPTAALALRQRGKVTVLLYLYEGKR